MFLKNLAIFLLVFKSLHISMIFKVFSLGGTLGGTLEGGLPPPRSTPLPPGPPRAPQGAPQGLQMALKWAKASLVLCGMGGRRQRRSL